MRTSARARPRATRVADPRLIRRALQMRPRCGSTSDDHSGAIADERHNETSTLGAGCRREFHDSQLLPVSDGARATERIRILGRGRKDVLNPRSGPGRAAAGAFRRRGGEAGEISQAQAVREERLAHRTASQSASILLAREIRSSSTTARPVPRGGPVGRPEEGGPLSTRGPNIGSEATSEFRPRPHASGHGSRVS